MTVLFLMAKYGWRPSIYIYIIIGIYKKNLYKKGKDNIVTQYSNNYSIHIVGNIKSNWVWTRKWKKNLKRDMFKKSQVLYEQNARLPAWDICARFHTVCTFYKNASACACIFVRGKSWLSFIMIYFHSCKKLSWRFSVTIHCNAINIIHNMHS